MNPVVSVVIPTYNHSQYVADTLDSVLAQTLADIEVIVVNDGSSDDTAEILRPYADTARIRYFEQPNAGPARARNRGLEEARGKYVAFLDDDDLWPTGKLEWQLAFLENRTDAVGVAGPVCWDWEQPPDHHRDLPFVALSLDDLLDAPIWSPGQSLLRAEVVRRIGGFDETIWGADDFDLWFGIVREGPFWIGGPISLFYRVHPANASRDDVRMFLNILSVVDKQLRDGHGFSSADPRNRAYRFLHRYKGSAIRQCMFSYLIEGRLKLCWTLTRKSWRFWIFTINDAERLRRTWKRVARRLHRSLATHLDRLSMLVGRSSRSGHESS